MISATHSIPNFDLDSIRLYRAAWALGPAVDAWRIGLHPLDGFPQLSFLFWGRIRTVLVCSLYGAVAAAIFRIITTLALFVVQGSTGDLADGVEWLGPTRGHDGVATVGGHHHGDLSGDAQSRRAGADSVFDSPAPTMPRPSSSRH